jgi:histidyl-tRNA synthetase
MDRLPGFRDFFPEPLPNQDAWSADARGYIFDAWRAVAKRYGFREYDGPPLESLTLFTAKSGDEIVRQLYNFNDKGGDEIALRPEMTPTFARMVAASERQYKKPIKWFSIPQLFRYERQQKGRKREHFQLNVDIVGEAGPTADAELIAVLIDVLREFRLTSEDFEIRLSSRDAWENFYGERGDSERAYEFYQIIDKLEREDPTKSDEKLKGLGFSLAEVREFIDRAEPTEDLRVILDDLAARDLAGYVRIDYNIIRGLAYYTGPVFEAFDKKGKFRAIAGGGRYNNLLKLVSGGKVDLPALGFGFGDVVLTDLLNERELMPDFKVGVDVFFMIEDEDLRAQSLRAVQELREAGVSVDYSLVPMRGNKQFKRATELNAVRTARIDRPEEGDTEFVVRNLATRDEFRVPIEKGIPGVLANLTQ